MTLKNALINSISASGLDCETLADGVAVRIADDTLYEPAAIVRCGERAGDAMEISDPVVVFEVVSSAKRGMDTAAKFAPYFSLPSVRHYVIIDAERRTVIHHRKAADGEFLSSILREGRVVLDPPGFELDVDEVLAGD